MSMTITNILLSNTDPQTLVADVLGANPTATTLLLNCPPGTDGNDCGTYNETVTYGAWAKPTPPPDATSGVYDVLVSEGTEWYYSKHCEMSSTVPVVCTTTNLGGNEDGHPTSTFTNVDPSGAFIGWAYMPVTITAGLDKLASAATATGATSVKTSAISGVITGANATSTSGTTIVSGTRTATSATTTSAAMRGQHIDAYSGTLALVSLAVGWLVR